MKREKKSALAKHLGIKVKDLSSELEDYLVLTDREAQEMASEYIKQSIWAFNAGFLSGHLKYGISQEVVEIIQANGDCESNNEALTCLIDDMDTLIDDAISSDGRGHFIASYDHEEIEAGNFYIYRIN